MWKLEPKQGLFLKTQALSQVKIKMLLEKLFEILFNGRYLSDIPHVQFLHHEKRNNSGATNAISNL